MPSNIHANLVSVNGRGVLILGCPGKGKSRLSYELIKRGHRLVADDLVILKLQHNKSLTGSCPKTGVGLMHVRGLGLLDVKKIFGSQAVKKNQRIDVVVTI